MQHLLPPKILAKAEFLNPGGSVKDRVAAQILEEALASGALRPGGTVTEGTAGSTGVSLALCARAAGCGAFVAMPDDAAREKADTLRTLGAEVRRMRPVSIAHPDHFVNVARRAAAEREGAVFANQFENLANFRAHLRTGEGGARAVWVSWWTLAWRMSRVCCSSSTVHGKETSMGVHIPRWILVGCTHLRSIPSWSAPHRPSPTHPGSPLAPRRA